MRTGLLLSLTSWSSRSPSLKEDEGEGESEEQGGRRRVMRRGRGDGGDEFAALQMSTTAMAMAPRTREVGAEG